MKYCNIIQEADYYILGADAKIFLWESPRDKEKASGVQILHNPHGDGEGSFFLHGFIRNHFGFRRIREKADLGDDSGDRIVPEKIIVRVWFDFSLVVLPGEISGLLLYERGEPFALFAPGWIEDLRAMLRTVRIAVLMDAHRTVWFMFCDDSFPVFQITGLFVGGPGVFQAAVGVSCQYRLDTVLFQHLPAFESDGEIDVFLLHAGGAYFSRVFSAVGRIEDAQIYSDSWMAS